MYFYYKIYTICTTFYNTFISLLELCMSLLTTFTYSSPSANSMIKPKLFTLNTVFLKHSEIKKVCT